MRGALFRIVCVMCAVVSLTACLKSEGVMPSSDANLDAALSAFTKEGGWPGRALLDDRFRLGSVRSCG